MLGHTAHLLMKSTFIVSLLWLTTAVTAAEGDEPFLTEADYASVDVAPTAGAAGEASSGDVAAAATQLGVGLLIVIALAVAAGVLLKRASRGGRRLLRHGGEHLEVIDSVALGLKRSVSVLRVGQHAVVVGQAEGGLTALATLPIAEVVGDPASPRVAPTAPSPPRPPEPHQPLDGGAEPRDFQPEMPAGGGAEPRDFRPEMPVGGGAEPRDFTPDAPTNRRETSSRRATRSVTDGDSYQPDPRARAAASREQTAAADGDKVANFQERLRRLQEGT